MSNEEANSLYKCTVREYHVLHKWDAGGSPSQAMDVQEMGVDGQDNRETGGSAADRIFFMKYPMSFLQHWYTTYPPPQQDTTTTGSSVVSPSSADVDVDMTGDRTSSHLLLGKRGALAPAAPEAPGAPAAPWITSPVQSVLTFLNSIVSLTIWLPGNLVSMWVSVH